MRWRIATLAVGLLILGLGPARSADDALLDEAIGLPGLAMWLESGSPGMVLAVVRGPDTIVRGYGETTKGNGKEPDANSLFRVASISKVFTTEVLASLVVEGKMRLSAPLQRYASAPVPHFGGKQITLLDLATHTAALPREMGAWDKPQFTGPGRADRWAWLPKQTLHWAPGTVAAYSNVGFDLLADALETASGKSYSDLLHARVTGPLAMADTNFTPSPEQCARLMTGTGIVPAAACLDTRATQGSGGLYSTGADMARWLRHNLDTGDPALILSHAIYRPRQTLPAAIGFDEAGPMAGLGLGWVVEAASGIKPMIVAKTGGGAGFMSYIAFAPGRGVGVFVVVNRTDFNMFGTLTNGANALIASLATR